MSIVGRSLTINHEKTLSGTGLDYCKNGFQTAIQQFRVGLCVESAEAAFAICGFVAGFFGFYEYGYTELSALSFVGDYFMEFFFRGNNVRSACAFQ